MRKQAGSCWPPNLQATARQAPLHLNKGLQAQSCMINLCDKNNTKLAVLHADGFVYAPPATYEGDSGMGGERQPLYEDLLAAAERIDGVANKTPVVSSRTLNDELGATVYFKCENLQRMGAFKFRGAFNFLSALPSEERRKGVVAYSSGNHAQAVALAARILGVKSTIVMPTDAPVAKVEATRGYGAEIVFYDRYTEDNELITAQIAQENGYLIIPPFNSPMIVAGQGTSAMELFDEVGTLDALFVPLGGGGLLSGSAIAARNIAPKCKVFGVEPVAGDDGLQSIRAGRLVSIESPRTIADGAQTPSLGTVTFPIIQRLVDDIFTATDQELISEMRYFAERLKLIVEPTGCLGLAAARAQKDKIRGKKVGIILSGGNVDLSRFGQLINSTHD